MRVRSTTFRLAAGLGAAFLLASCASTDYHYSQLSGMRYNRVPIDTYPVSIVRVDGKDTLIGPLSHIRAEGKDGYQRPYSLVDPGMRQVTVQGPPGGAGGIGENRTVSLEIAPCTRYYLVAVKTTPLASDFTVRVDHQEPVSGCTPSRPS
ncbi:MAG: hypothetical protein ACXWCV_17620 [Caldimonas sp.]